MFTDSFGNTRTRIMGEGETFCNINLVEACLQSWSVEYEGNCKPTTSEMEVCKTFPPIEPNCDNNSLQTVCIQDGDCFTFDFNDGNLAFPYATRTIQYRCEPNGDWIDWRPGDDPICCDFIQSRAVVVFCDSRCPVYCSDPVECMSEPDCELGGELSCEECIITFTPSVGDPNDWTITWCRDGVIITNQNDLSIEADQSGLYEIKFDQAGCSTQVFEWVFTLPEAGETDRDANNPVDVD